MADAPSGAVPTRISTLATAAVIGAGAMFLLMLAASSYSLTMPDIGWTTPILIFIGAVAAAVYARITYVRNHVTRQHLDPQRSLSTLAIAKACLIGGALLLGGYLAFALFSVANLDAPLPKRRLLIGLVAAGAAAGLVFSGWVLERACRTPKNQHKNLD